MMVSRWSFGVMALAISVLGFTLLRPVSSKPSADDRVLFSMPSPPPPRTPSEVARWEASHEWGRAERIVVRELERLEEWDPTLDSEFQEDIWRRERLAADPGGALGRARAAARRAVLLSRTPDELYSATLVSTWLASEASDRPGELKQARRLIALRPRDPRSAMWLEHALTSDCLNSPKPQR